MHTLVHLSLKKARAKRMNTNLIWVLLASTRCSLCQGTVVVALYGHNSVSIYADTRLSLTSESGKPMPPRAIHKIVTFGNVVFAGAGLIANPDLKFTDVARGARKRSTTVRATAEAFCHDLVPALTRASKKLQQAAPKNWT
jgi:hypothetical protein